MSYAQENALFNFNDELVMHLLLDLPPTETTCFWPTRYGHVCGATLPMDRDIVSTHLRNDHALGGDSKEMVTCFWGDCHSRPVQRQSLVRHILSVHLRLLNWTCPICSKTLARKGTHKCRPAGLLLQHA
ncbi:hypothetical protein V8E55_012107 [Tylopilus felleus]